MTCRTLMVLICALVALSSAVFAETLQVIRLKDDSVIRGTVVEMKDGAYRIKTPIMGEVKIPADQVLSIVVEGAAVSVGQPESAASSLPPAPAIRETPAPPPVRVRSAPPPAKAAAPDPYAPATDNMRHQQDMVNTSVQSMAMEEDFLDKVMQLGQNPDMLDVMNDQSLMDAINSQDYQSLMQNEKMQRLMNSPDLRELLGNVQSGAGE